MATISPKPTFQDATFSFTWGDHFYEVNFIQMPEKTDHNVRVFYDKVKLLDVTETCAANKTTALAVLERAMANQKF